VNTTRLNVVTGRHFDIHAFRQLQAQARCLYEANRHLFADELDAMVAVGAVPLRDALLAERGLVTGGPPRSPA
jgi:hypothetical protein